MQKHIRYGSVCSGIEAATRAWKPLGWKCEFVAEFEKFPSAVLHHHDPEVPNYGDITKFKEWPEHSIDVLIGGTPCQSFSVAGLRKGLSDPRGNLALTFLAIANRYRPRWILWENVPGVHSSWTDETVRPPTEAEAATLRERGLDPGEYEYAEQSNDFDQFLAGMEELGYGVATTILDAQFFGVAQRRERVFVVGHIGGLWQRSAAVLFDPACLRGNPPPSREKGKAVAGTLKACASSGSWSNSADFAAGGYMQPVEVCGTLSARTQGGGGRD
jgi:DNA (cytosine-5)-methyltransferase 1